MSSERSATLPDYIYLGAHCVYVHHQKYISAIITHIAPDFVKVKYRQSKTHVCYVNVNIADHERFILPENPSVTAQRDQAYAQQQHANRQKDALWPTWLQQGGKCMLLVSKTVEFSEMSTVPAHMQGCKWVQADVVQKRGNFSFMIVYYDFDDSGNEEKKMVCIEQAQLFRLREIQVPNFNPRRFHP